MAIPFATSFSARARLAHPQSTKWRQLHCSMGVPDVVLSFAIRVADFTPLTGVAPSAAKQTPSSTKTPCRESPLTDEEGPPRFPGICARRNLALLSCDSLCPAKRQRDSVFFS